MIYFYIIAGFIVAFPFLFTVFGFLFSLTEPGRKGVKWRQDLAYTIDLVAASCLGFGRYRTISGKVGEKVSAKNVNWMWPYFEWFIDHLPPFYKGHCRDAWQNEQ